MPTLEPSSTSVQEPGWYPDPVTDGRTERWWTGQAWAGYSRPRTELRPAPPPAARTATSTALLSFLLGGIGVVLALGSVLGDGHVWVTSVGVFAVISGVRALVMRARRSVVAQLLAVTGIAAGGLATLIMVALLLVPFSGPGRPADVGAVGAAPSTVPTGGSGPAPSATYTGLPAGTVLQVVPRQPLPDDALDSYSTVRIRPVRSATAGCGVLRADPLPLPSDSYPTTAARHAQDFAGSQVDAMRSTLIYGPQVTKPMTWPAALDIDPDTNVVYIPRPTCQTLGVLPKGDELHYGMSPDRGQIVLAIWNTTYRTGELWRSVDDTGYAL